MEDTPYPPNGVYSLIKYGLSPIDGSRMLWYTLLKESAYYLEADPVRAMVVHKNDMIRHHLADFLTVAGIEVISDVTGLEELKVTALRWKPHIIIMDVQFINQTFPSFLEDLKSQTVDAKWAITGPEPYEYYARYTEAIGADLYFSEAQHPNEWLEGLNTLVPWRVKTHHGL